MFLRRETTECCVGPKAGLEVKSKSLSQHRIPGA